MLSYTSSLADIVQNGKVLKEDLFNWVVDLSQAEFNRLCNEVIALYAFQAKYDGLLVTDEEALLRPYLPVLPKVAFCIERYHKHYDKKNFYRILSIVSDDYVNRVCAELSGLREHVDEHANTYIINGVSHAVPPHIQYWRVTYHGKPITKYFSSVVASWGRSVQ